jgi:hypothetical protein
MAEVSDVDPGLQPQRTALAWNRTGLSVFVNGLIVLRAGILAKQHLILGLATLLLAAAGAAVACGVWRARQLHAHGARAAPPWMLIVATAWVAWLACLAALASMAVTMALP